MLTLWHCLDARSFRALWTLEEMRLPYQLRLLPFPPRVHAPDYLQRNLLGTIPLLEDGEARLTESAACCLYLATRYGPTDIAIRPDEPDYGACLNALHYGEATLTFPLTIALRYGRFEPEKGLQQAADDYARWFMARLRGLTAWLGTRDYLCSRFSVADISVGYALMLATELGLGARFAPTVAAYWARLQAREGFRRADAAQRAVAAGSGVAETFD